MRTLLAALLAAALLVASASPASAAAPDTQITSGPVYGTKVLPGTTVTYEFAAVGTADSFECSVDGSAYAVCTSPQSFDLPVGSHVFAVRAKNLAEADATPATTMWIVRNVPCEQAGADYAAAQGDFFRYKTRKGYKKEALQRALEAGNAAKVDRLRKKIKKLNKLIRQARNRMEAAAAQEQAVC
jgi:hypothetical protein